MTIPTATEAEVAAGVHATVAAYAHALDAGRTDDLVGTFCPDGSAEISGMGTFHGHASIRDAYAALLPTHPQLHLVANTVISSWTEHEAAAVSNFTFLQRGESGWVVPVTGRYDDVFHKGDDGAWRIHSRTTSYVI